MTTNVTFDDVYGPDPMVAALGAVGITPSYLDKRLKRELNAKETHRVKVKGAVKEDLPKGRKLVTTSGTVYFDKEGKLIGGDGDSVIEWSEINWKVLQAARIDAQKLLGAYPAEQHEVDGEVRLNVIYDESRNIESDD